MSDRPQTPPIQVWPFYDAPERFRALSPHGGDEDWVAYVPPEYELLDVGWAYAPSAFGVCETSEHAVEDGGLVLIGCHA